MISDREQPLDNTLERVQLELISKAVLVKKLEKELAEAKLSIDALKQHTQLLAQQLAFTIRYNQLAPTDAEIYAAAAAKGCGPGADGGGA